MKCAREGCNWEFRPSREILGGGKPQKYCSSECRWRSKRPRRTKKKCARDECDNQFMPRNSGHKYCSACSDFMKERVVKEWRAKNPHKVRQYEKQYKTKNRAKIRTSKNEYGKRNRIRTRTWRRTYIAKEGNRDKVRELRRRWIRTQKALEQAYQLNQLMENVMAVLQPKQSQDQNEALGDFIAKWANLKESTLAAAKAYKACIDLDMDMSQYVKDRRLHEKLLLIASDKLLPMSQAELLFLPVPMATILATLPPREQERVMKNGIDVFRRGKVERVAFVNLSGLEVKAAIDTTGGIGRVVDPKEQAERAKARNIPKAHDELVTLRMTYSQIVELRSRAHKAGKPVERLIMDLLNEQGMI